MTEQKRNHMEEKTFESLYPEAKEMYNHFMNDILYTEEDVKLWFAEAVIKSLHGHRYPEYLESDIVDLEIVYNFLLNKSDDKGGD